MLRFPVCAEFATIARVRVSVLSLHDLSSITDGFVWLPSSFVVQRYSVSEGRMPPEFGPEYAAAGVANFCIQGLCRLC